jgi:YidC/Oxa1 family membrane protein insertase
VLDFLYTAVSWVLLRWHQLFSFIGLDPAGGLNWSLSIVFLVVTARLLLFRLFVKQVKYQRHMQEMQPKLQAVREKYKNDRGEMQRQMMKLQQEQGFNPLAGCLPMFLQIPIFISLFHVLRHLSNSVTKCDLGSAYTGHLLSLYTFNQTQTCNAAQAKLFHAPLAASLHDSVTAITTLGGDVSATRIVTVILVVISAAATFLTQRFAMANLTTMPTGTAATVQRLMKVFIPISVLFSGVIFPLGVLLYWFTSNVWTMLQQMYINRFHPHTPKDAPELGAVGRTLAPKVGQRPVRDGRGRATLVKDTQSSANTAQPRGTSVGDGADDGADAPAPRASTPRPGQRPNRPGGNRPPGKKKRR